MICACYSQDIFVICVQPFLVIRDSEGVVCCSSCCTRDLSGCVLNW